MKWGAVGLFCWLCAAREPTFRGLETTSVRRHLVSTASHTLQLNDTTQHHIIQQQQVVPQPQGVIYKTRFLDWRFKGADHATAYNIIIAIILVLFAGFASGMTVGLVSIDTFQLKILQEEGTQEERRQAEKLEAILSNHHLLLVTLLLANSIAMEALPIFLNKTVPEWAAVALSVTAILAFGEVLPQAICTGRWQIPIVMKALPIVNLLIYVLFILAWPIARLLDVILGHNATTYYARSHLKALIRIHQKERRAGIENNNHKSNEMASNDDMGSALGADEVIVIEGALDLATKMVEDIMVPIDDVYMLEWDTRLTPAIRRELLEKGHSRVPIYKQFRHNVKGLLLIKYLICLDTHESPKVGDLLKANRPPVFCEPSLQLYDLLNEFQRGRHMAFVTLSPDLHRNSWGRADVQLPSSPAAHEQLLGIATLEDVIEELIQEEIYDEFDHYQSAALPPRNVRDNSIGTADASTAVDRQGLKESQLFESVSHLQTRAPTATFGSTRESVSEVSPETLSIANKSRRIRDVKTIPRESVYKHTNLVGSELNDLNKRLIEADDPPLFHVPAQLDASFIACRKPGGLGVSTAFRRGGKGRTVLVKRTTEKSMVHDENAPPLTNPSPKTSSQASIFRKYHSTDLDGSGEILLADASSKSMRNLVGIAAARQMTHRLQKGTKLATIQSSAGLSISGALPDTPAKSEAEPPTEAKFEDRSPADVSEPASKSDYIFTAES